MIKFKIEIITVVYLVKNGDTVLEGHTFWNNNVRDVCDQDTSLSRVYYQHMSETRVQILGACRMDGRWPSSFFVYYESIMRISYTVRYCIK